MYIYNHFVQTVAPTDFIVYTCLNIPGSDGPGTDDPGYDVIPVTTDVLDTVALLLLIDTSVTLAFATSI
jgi:hypothetical protein